MGTLIVTEFVTLDGVAQAPGAPEEDQEDGFAFGGWQAPLIDEESGEVMFEAAKDMDALLLGRKTYDIFAGYWPSTPKEIPFTDLLNGVPKYVASRSLTEPLSWSGSTILDGDLAEAITEVKARHARCTSSAASTCCSPCWRGARRPAVPVGVPGGARGRKARVRARHRPDDAHPHEVGDLPRRLRQPRVLPRRSALVRRHERSVGPGHPTDQVRCAARRASRSSTQEVGCRRRATGPGPRFATTHRPGA